MCIHEFLDDLFCTGQDIIDSWIQTKNVDDILAECDVEDEVHSIPLACYDKPPLSEYSHYNNRNSSSLLDSTNLYNEVEAKIQKPGEVTLYHFFNL